MNSECDLTEEYTEAVLPRTVWGGQVPSSRLRCSESSARVQTRSFPRHLAMPASASKSSFLHARADLARPHLTVLFPGFSKPNKEDILGHKQPFAALFLFASS